MKIRADGTKFGYHNMITFLLLSLVKLETECDPGYVPNKIGKSCIVGECFWRGEVGTKLGSLL